MQPQQQWPTPPIYMKYTIIGLPKHTIVLFLTTYVPNTQHNALHCNRNIILGSSGVAKSFKWMGVGIVYPPYHKSIIEAIHKARMATKEDPSTTTIITCNHHAPKILETHRDIYPILDNPPNTSWIQPTPKRPNTYTNMKINTHQ